MIYLLVALIGTNNAMESRPMSVEECDAIAKKTSDVHGKYISFIEDIAIPETEQIYEKADEMLEQCLAQAKLLGKNISKTYKNIQSIIDKLKELEHNGKKESEEYRTFFNKLSILQGTFKLLNEQSMKLESQRNKIILQIRKKETKHSKKIRRHKKLIEKEKVEKQSLYQQEYGKT